MVKIKKLKRHLFSIFIFAICSIAWIVILKGGVHSAAQEITAPAIEEDAATNETPILGQSQYTVEQAKAWSKGRGATDEFINLADQYWKIGALMGTRPDVMYAQAAKETAFGHFTGNITADMNNFAGIKKVDATGDTRDDHESFATPEAGIQAHYNHMAAYVGVQPLGQIHQRYYSVLSTSWAGTIKYVEQLGGKWAPDETYGTSIVNDYLSTMGDYLK